MTIGDDEAILVLRPRLAHVASSIVIFAVFAAGMIVLCGVAGARTHSAGLVVVGAAIGLAPLAPILLGLLNLQIIVTRRTVVYVDPLRRHRGCAADGLAYIEEARVPQRVIQFVRTDGRVALQVNARWWTVDQLAQLQEAFGGPP